VASNVLDGGEHDERVSLGEVSNLQVLQHAVQRIVTYRLKTKESISRQYKTGMAYPTKLRVIPNSSPRTKRRIEHDQSVLSLFLREGLQQWYEFEDITFYHVMNACLALHFDGKWRPKDHVVLTLVSPFSVQLQVVDEALPLVAGLDYLLFIVVIEKRHCMHPNRFSTIREHFMKPRFRDLFSDSEVFTQSIKHLVFCFAESDLLKPLMSSFFVVYIEVL